MFDPFQIFAIWVVIECERVGVSIYDSTKTERKKGPLMRFFPSLVLPELYYLIALFFFAQLEEFHTLCNPCNLRLSSHYFFISQYFLLWICIETWYTLLPTSLRPHCEIYQSLLALDLMCKRQSVSSRNDLEWLTDVTTSLGNTLWSQSPGTY